MVGSLLERGVTDDKIAVGTGAAGPVSEPDPDVGKIQRLLAFL
jgi:hypothetical protein